LEGRGLESRPTLDGNGVKAMPGWIPVTNFGSFNNRKSVPNGACRAHQVFKNSALDHAESTYIFQDNQAIPPWF